MRKLLPPVVLVPAVLTLSMASLAASLAFRGGADPWVPDQGLSMEALAATVWVEEFDLSPDGDLVAFKSARDGTYELWTVPTAGGDPTRITELGGRAMAPVFSPDGRWIAFEVDFGGTDVRDIWVIPSEGGEARRLTHHPLNDSRISWAPDSRSLYFNTGMFWDNSVARAEVETGEITRIGPGGSGALSPDGRSFAFTGNRLAGDDDQSNSDIYVMPVEGGEWRLLTPGDRGLPGRGAHLVPGRADPGLHLGPERLEQPGRHRRGHRGGADAPGGGGGAQRAPVVPRRPLDHLHPEPGLPVPHLPDPGRRGGRRSASPGREG
jgi:WD40 repeat protein